AGLVDWRARDPPRQRTPGHASAVFRSAESLEQPFEIRSVLRRHRREAEPAHFLAFAAFAFSRAIVLSAVSSRTASLPIQRAVLSEDMASFSASARAGACSASERLPMVRKAQ